MTQVTSSTGATTFIDLMMVAVALSTAMATVKHFTNVLPVRAMPDGARPAAPAVVTVLVVVVVVTVVAVVVVVVTVV